MLDIQGGRVIKGDNIMFEDFTDYNDCEPAGLRLPKIELDSNTLEILGLEKDSTSFEILKKLSREGIRNRGIDKLENKKEYYDRTIMELDLFNELGFVDYVLLNWEIINFAKKNGVFVGDGRGCFIAGSKVKLSDGCVKNIEFINIGEMVIDHEGNSNKVIDTLQYDIEEDILEIELENGKVIECTINHKFYTENRGWVEAQDLTEEDEIREI